MTRMDDLGEEFTIKFVDDFCNVERSVGDTAAKGDGLAPSKPGFNSRWKPYESLVVEGRTSGLNCSCVAVQVLPYV